MKLDELLDNALPYKIVKNSDGVFAAQFTAGDREIYFSAENEGAMDDFDEGEWHIVFGEIQIKKRTTLKLKSTDPDTVKTLAFNKTGSGNEIQVFSTLKSIISKLIKEHNPKRLLFSADKDVKNNRARLYAKLFKKNMPSGWKVLTGDNEVDHEPVLFSIVKEGMMKRSDPYISGEKSGPRPPEMKLAPQPVSAHKSKLQTLMRKSGKSMEKVEAAWNKAVRETPDGPAKWANVMKRAKADLGISV